MKKTRTPSHGHFNSKTVGEIVSVAAADALAIKWLRAYWRYKGWEPSRTLMGLEVLISGLIIIFSGALFRKLTDEKAGRRK